MHENIRTACVAILYTKHKQTIENDISHAMSQQPGTTIVYNVYVQHHEAESLSRGQVKTLYYAKERAACLEHAYQQS